MISDRSILKVALKGAVSATKDLIEMFRALDSYEIMCLLENNGSKIGQDIAGVRVVPTIEVRKAYRKGTLDAVVMPGNLGTKTLASMARELRSMGVRSDDLYVAVSPPLGHMCAAGSLCGLACARLHRVPCVPRLQSELQGLLSFFFVDEAEIAGL